MQNLGLDNAALGQMYSNNPESRWINRHQMSLCGKCDGHTAGDFVKLAKFAGIRHYAEIIEQVREAVALNEVSNPQFLIKNADCIPQKM